MLMLKAKLSFHAGSFDKTLQCLLPISPAGRRRVAAECDAERHEEDDDEGGEGEVEPVGLEPRAVGDRLHPDLAHVRVVVGRLDGAGHGRQAVLGDGVLGVLLGLVHAERQAVVAVLGLGVGRVVAGLLVKQRDGGVHWLI